MESPSSARFSLDSSSDGEEGEEVGLVAAGGGEEDEKCLSMEEEQQRGGFFFRLLAPLRWFRMLAHELHWSFVFGVVSVYGISQGMGGAIWRVSVSYYWKDVQKVQPSQSQFYMGMTSIPWIVKPLWGILTDILPVFGYRRRPYFIIAGLIGAMSMLTLSLNKNLRIFFALLAMTGGSASAAIADVTIDACVAENSISHPSLAPDMQSLCGLSSSIGGLLGFSISGLLLHALGPQGVLGSITISSVLLITVGLVLNETRSLDVVYAQVNQKFLQASRTMWKTLTFPAVWRPSFYMYASLALSLNIQEGMFYWYTEAESGPTFSQEIVGFIFSLGSVGAFFGVILFQTAFKDTPFRRLLFWCQLLSGVAGMLDLALIMRLNLKVGIPDYFFVVIDEGVSQMINRLKWMPMLVLSSKLCPAGIEGTFFALLMSIDNVGLLTSSWGGGLMLHLLNVTRNHFDNLWAAILIRNFLRLLPLGLLYLIPSNIDQHSRILPADACLESDDDEKDPDAKVIDVELASLVVDERS